MCNNDHFVLRQNDRFYVNGQNCPTSQEKKVINGLEYTTAI